MLRIEILRSAQCLEPLRAAWQRLFRPGRHTMFQSPLWNLLAARAFSAWEPMVIHAESDSGAAIIPACTAGDQIGFLGDEMFDYRDVLAAGDREVLRRAWRQVPMAGQSLRLVALRGGRAYREWVEIGFKPRSFCAAPVARRSDLCAPDFAAAHTRSARFLRRLARRGVQMRARPGSDAALVRAIYEAKGRQEITANLFSDPARIGFMVAIAAADPGCEIFTLETAGTLVAALVTFRDGHARRFYTIYHDPAWAHDSPGIALICEVTRRSLEQGLDCDYMTGEHPHKTRFSTAAEPLFWVEAKAEDLGRIGGASPEMARAPSQCAA